MKSFITTTLFFIALIGGVSVQAQSLSIETDPATFAFKGHSAHIRYQFNNNWAIGVGTYSMEFPEAFQSLALEESSKDSNLKLKSGVGIFIDKFFGDKDGLFVGIQIAKQSYELSDDRVQNVEKTYDATLIMPRIGYKMNIGSSGLFVLPWMGIGSIQSDEDQLTIGSTEYKAKNILPFATLHVGYQF